MQATLRIAMAASSVIPLRLAMSAGAELGGIRYTLLFKHPAVGNLIKSWEGLVRWRAFVARGFLSSQLLWAAVVFADHWLGDNPALAGEELPRLRVNRRRALPRNRRPWSRCGRPATGRFRSTIFDSTFASM